MGERRHRVVGEWMARGLAAGLLLVGAYLKYEELLSPAVREGRLLQLLLVDFEVVLGGWLLSGWWKRGAFGVGVGTFVVFSFVSAWKAVRGEGDCGCFGEVVVSPWAMMGVDAVVVVLLLIWFPSARSGGSEERPRVVGWGAVVGLVVLSVSHRMATYAPGRLDESGLIVGDRAHVELSPEEWVGKTFMLLPRLSGAPDLMTGKWTLMFVRHNCPVCHEGLARLMEDVGDRPGDERVGRVVIVEVPPYGEMGEVGEVFRVARLKDDREWLVGTPVVVQLRDGVVMSAGRGVVRLEGAATTGPS